MSTGQSIAAVINQCLRYAEVIETISAQTTFHHAFDVYLKDSNAYANTYFAPYFEWQGVVRERWFHECVDAELLMNGQVIFVAKQAHQEFVEETFPFQRVDCYLNPFRVQPCSLHLVFRFVSQGRSVSLGYQQVVCADAKRNMLRLPEHVRLRVKEYEMGALPQMG